MTIQLYAITVYNLGQSCLSRALHSERNQPCNMIHHLENNTLMPIEYHNAYQEDVYPNHGPCT